MEDQDDKETAALEVGKPIFIPKIDSLGILFSFQSNNSIDICTKLSQKGLIAHENNEEFTQGIFSV